jgi:tetratricopeptide (TPR) repeat protein
VIHISFNVKEGEGVELSKRFKVGHTYPVFILTSAEGRIIYRWTGYTGARTFIGSLNKALSDLTAIEDRIRKFEAKPTHEGALTLAKYFTDTGEYLDAVRFYKEADRLKSSPGIDYSYEIFSSSANAAWNGMTTFPEVLPTADSILYAARKNGVSRVKVAQAMSRLTRQLGKEDYLKKYLQAGLDMAAGAPDQKNRDTHTALRIEYALQIEHDTSEALTMKKEDLGADWQKNPDKFYNFAKWCLERKVNLQEAEALARTAVNYAQDGEFKGQVLHTAAEICFARGNLEDAIAFIDQAIKQDPGNAAYMDAQDLYLENWGKKR